MIDWITSLYANSDWVKLFFWGPMALNLIIYPVHVWKRVQRDRKKLKKGYTPYDFVTVGDLFKYAFLTFTPVLNALALIFHAAPIAWEYLADHLEWLFSIKLAGGNKED